MIKKNPNSGSPVMPPNDKARDKIAIFVHHV